jgi:hypothetical protein
MLSKKIKSVTCLPQLVVEEFQPARFLDPISKKVITRIIRCVFFRCSGRGFPKFINIYTVDIFDDDISIVHTGRVTVSCHWEAVYGVGLHLREDSCVWLNCLPRQLSALVRSYNLFRLNAP